MLELIIREEIKFNKIQVKIIIQIASMDEELETHIEGYNNTSSVVRRELNGSTEEAMKKEILGSKTSTLSITEETENQSDKKSKQNKKHLEIKN